MTQESLVASIRQRLRNKDFFDIRFILRTEKLDPGVLAQAIRSTFERRKTLLPTAVPGSLSPEFAAEKESLWSAFLRRNGIAIDGSFVEVVGEIVARLPYRWETGPKGPLRL